MKKIPHPLTIIMGIAVLAALATWLIPAGRFDTLKYENHTFAIQRDTTAASVPFTQHTLDSLHIATALNAFVQGDIHKPVAIPGTYHRLPPSRQGLIDMIESPVKGMYDVVDIVLFLLILGGFIGVFNATGAMEKGLLQLSVKMKGREGWLIIVLTFLLILAGSSYGMGEEAIVFYPILVPLFLAAGYDLIVPVAVIFGGTQLGTLSSFSNPFSTIIASNTIGISWTDGFTGRLLMFVVSGIIYITYILRYAQKVKRNPQASLVYRYHGNLQSPFPGFVTSGERDSRMGSKAAWLLVLFFAAFCVMIYGVVALHWWMLEMSAVFLVAAVLAAVIGRINQSDFVNTFIKGAESLLGVTLIIGAARGITILLNSGNISDSIVYYTAQSISGLPPGVFVVLLLLLFILFSFFIASSSGMAVLTMPIIGSLALAVHVPGREVVNSYLYGMGISFFIAPIGLILPSLALVNISLSTWWQFIWPFMAMLFVLCAMFLIVGVYL